MRLYRFHLPDKTNAGDYKAARDGRQAWKEHAMRLAGGFTAVGKASGAWKDPKTGDIYWERMWIYEVAVEDGKGEATRRRLVQLFRECFPDQLAVFSAEVGEAWID